MPGCNLFDALDYRLSGARGRGKSCDEEDMSITVIQGIDSLVVTAAHD